MLAIFEGTSISHCEVSSIHHVNITEVRAKPKLAVQVILHGLHVLACGLTSAQFGNCYKTVLFG